MMETSKLAAWLSANPEMVRGGSARRAENHSGAAIWTLFGSRCAGVAARYPRRGDYPSPTEVPAVAGTRVVPRDAESLSSL